MTSPVKNNSPRLYDSPPLVQSTDILNSTPPTFTTPTLLDYDPASQQTDQANIRSSRIDFGGERQELGEETPLLKNRHSSPIYRPTSPIDLSRRQKSASPSRVHRSRQNHSPQSPLSPYSQTNLRQEYMGNLPNNNNSDSVFETNSISNNSYDESDSDGGSNTLISSRRPSKIQTDVCFPMLETASKKGVDYDSLEDYIKNENEKRRKEQRRRQRRLSESASVFVKKDLNYIYNSLENKHPSERFTFYSTAYSTIHARSLAEIPSAGTSLSEMLKAGCWWIDILAPTDSEVQDLGRIFGIHPLTIEDIQTEDTREKCELFKEYYFICFRTFDQDHYSPTYLQPVSIYMIVMKEGILSFHFRPSLHPSNVRRRIRQLKDYINVTPDWINYAIIDDITDSFAPLIRTIEFEVDSIDELVLILKESEQSDMLRRIGHCRKKVLGLLRLLGNKADVMKGLIKRCNELRWDVVVSSEIVLYLGDIQDHIITMVQNLNHYEKILSRSHSNYLAQISIEMTQTNNQINDVLSRLTALGTILIPMNLVTGLWGMNVPVPGQESEGLTWFFSILASLIIFAIVLVVMAHRTGIV
ncbi:cora-domain-containing protein [Rhizophagus irregularis]|uniref:Cora-domain-containing protein n=1 Tax=Rhizophagus irregularis TaxID=588596 RepID=A0A2N0RR64_9GLOM|nr:cora-domain-containing protein [Rhizophagus irregularis]